MMSGEIRDAIEEITIESECTNNNDGHFQSMKKVKYFFNLYAVYTYTYPLPTYIICI